MTRPLIVVAFLVLVSELCPVGFAAELETNAGEWKLISDKDGVAIYRRQRPLSYESKAVGEIPASTDLVHAVLDDLESYSSFMPYTAECRVLKREGDSVVAYERIS
ncbi:MAG: Polyketide cyclase / dehydrase and lipid transport, partial [Verrucomicrobiota bacterium]